MSRSDRDWWISQLHMPQSLSVADRVDEMNSAIIVRQSVTHSHTAHGAQHSYATSHIHHITSFCITSHRFVSHHILQSH
jgi:hypothetical protein